MSQCLFQDHQIPGLKRLINIQKCHSSTKADHCALFCIRQQFKFMKSCSELTIKEGGTWQLIVLVWLTLSTTWTGEGLSSHIPGLALGTGGGGPTKDQQGCGNLPWIALFTQMGVTTYIDSHWWPVKTTLSYQRNKQLAWRMMSQADHQPNLERHKQ